MTTGLLTTTLGRAAMVADLGGGADLVLTHVAWGDASGVPYNPNDAQVALVNERYRATIASVAVVAGAIVVDAIIPADTPDGSGRPSHGFNVAEVGLFNAAGVLIGVARMGNGYKPPPSSGQASIATFRLKLACANPSAITVVIDPQAQLVIGRDVRPPWITVDGVLNDPPAAPALGATYVIGPAPTGAWTGFAQRIAQWVGVWSLATVPIGHHVVDNSQGIDTGARWLERTAAGWKPGVSRLIQRQLGNWAGAAGGTASAMTVTLDPAPTDWDQLIGVPIRFLTTVAAAAALTFAPVGLAAKPMIWPDGIAIPAGGWGVGAALECFYDGAKVQVVAGAMPPLALSRGIATFSVAGAATFTATYTGLHRVTGWAGGAGGGYSLTGTSAAGGGGPGGACVKYFFLIKGVTYNLIIGPGGLPGLTSGVAPTSGGTTSFDGVALASGGSPGVSVGANQAGGGGTAGTGLGTGVCINAQGSHGSQGYNVANLGGAGGDAPLGGGYGGRLTQQTGTAGSEPGGGGAGAINGNGGPGAPGGLRIEW